MKSLFMIQRQLETRSAVAAGGLGDGTEGTEVPDEEAESTFT